MPRLVLWTRCLSCASAGGHPPAKAVKNEARSNRLLRASHFTPLSLLFLRHRHRNRYSLTAPLGAQRNSVSVSLSQRLGMTAAPVVSTALSVVDGTVPCLSVGAAAGVRAGPDDRGACQGSTKTVTTTASRQHFYVIY